MTFCRPPGFWTAVAENWGIDLVPCSSQTADWFVWSRYCAEAPSALSNIGFFVVGAWFDFWPLHAAGLASLVSHCIPWNIFLWLDKFCVLLVLGFLAKKAPSVMFMLPFLASLGLLAFVEVQLRRRGWHNVHDVWHLGAAFIAYVYLRTVHAFRELAPPP